MFKKFLGSCLAVGLLAGPVAMCRAVTFAEVAVNQTVAPGSPAIQYTFDNATTNFTTVPRPTNAVFHFDILGAPSALSNVPVSLDIFGNALAAGPAGVYNPITKTQPLASFGFTISATAASGFGYTAGQVLLKGTFTNPAIFNATLSQNGLPNGTANLTAANNIGLPGNFLYTSPFFTFDPAQLQTGTFSFSTVSPAGFAPGLNPLYLQTMPFLNGNGNFAATPTVATPVPEPGAVALFMCSGVGACMFIRRRRSASSV